MTVIDRNPDVNLSTETVPKGMTLLEGKNLQNTARHLKIPFGVAFSRTRILPGSPPRRNTVGIILRDADVPAFREAQERTAVRRARELAQKSDRRAE